MRLPGKDRDELYKLKKKISEEIDKIGRKYRTRKRPYGQRTTVIRAVRIWWNKTYPKKRITDRYVKTCHDEYRKFLRDKAESNEKEELEAILAVAKSSPEIV